MAGAMAGPDRCTLIIDGTCALCRASGRAAQRLDPRTEIADGGPALAKAEGVVLLHGDARLEGLDAVLGWLELQDERGARLARLARSRPLHAVLERAYRFIARHRHALDRVTSESSRRRSRGR